MGSSDVFVARDTCHELYYASVSAMRELDKIAGQYEGWSQSNRGQCFGRR